MAGSEALDIDPTLALELLPEKIKTRQKQITDLALEISIAREIMPNEDLSAFEKQLDLHKKFLTMYQSRLDAAKAALAGT